MGAFLTILAVNAPGWLRPAANQVYVPAALKRHPGELRLARFAEPVSNIAQKLTQVASNEVGDFYLQEERT
jgi:hypothetical protein